MVRRSTATATVGGSSPHPRGDGPRFACDCYKLMRFSPPAWGWSACARTTTGDGDVLPTRVGMVRSARVTRSRRWCSPHPRGDGPFQSLVVSFRDQFSPPAWGWSALGPLQLHRGFVLPTRVGMVRAGLRYRLPRGGSPHPRGDGPDGETKKTLRVKFSPPAWGWSADVFVRRFIPFVLPTRVGMVRVPLLATCAPWSSPHPRGDGPISHCAEFTFRKFSPPAWGWSGVIAGYVFFERVLPTRVGMVRDDLQDHNP